MQTLTLDNTLYNQISDVATEDKTTPSDVVREAFKLYAWQRQQEQVSAEAKHYRQQHADLKKRYIGLFVAMLNGEVIDSDREFLPLHKRIRKQHGNRGVFITQVNQEPLQTLQRRNYQFE